MATKMISGGVYGGSSGLTQLAIPMISTVAGQDLEDSPLRYVSVTIPAASVLTLRATPYEIVAAPGTGLVAMPLYGEICLDYGTVAYTESSANLALKWNNGSGAQISQTVEMTGFIDQAADTVTSILAKIDAIAAASAAANKAIVLHNLGGGEFANSGDGVLRLKLIYAVFATGL